MRWLESSNKHKFEQTVGDSGGQESDMLQSILLQRLGHDLATEQEVINMRVFISVGTLACGHAAFKL